MMRHRTATRKSEACFTRRISVASNAIQTTDEMANFETP